MSALPAGGSKRSLASLWAMVAIFAAPVVAAWFFYFNPQYLPAGRSNRGELIQPAAPLPAGLVLRTLEGAPFDRAALSGKWTLVLLDGEDCGDACIARLRDLRQIRLALGEGRLQVERLLLLGEAAPGRVAELAGEFAGMKVAVLDAADRGRILERLGGEAAAMGRVYILDPMGNLMMRYAPDAPAKDTLKDMERLLKASKNWTKGTQYGHE